MATTTPEEAVLMDTGKVVGDTGKMTPDAKTGSARNFTQAEADALNKAIAAGGSAGAAGFQSALARNQQAAIAAAADIGRSASAMQAASPEVLQELAGILDPAFAQSNQEIMGRQASSAQAMGDLQGLSTNFAQAAQSALPIVQSQADAARMLAEGQALAAAKRGEFGLQQTLANAQNDRLRLALERRQMEMQAEQAGGLGEQINMLGGFNAINTLAQGLRLQNPDAPDDILAQQLSAQTGLPFEFTRGLVGMTPMSEVGRLQLDTTAGRRIPDIEQLFMEQIEGARRPGGVSGILGRLPGVADERQPLNKRVFGDTSGQKAEEFITGGGVEGAMDRAAALRDMGASFQEAKSILVNELVSEEGVSAEFAESIANEAIFLFPR